MTFCRSLPGLRKVLVRKTRYPTYVEKDSTWVSGHPQRQTHNQVKFDSFVQYRRSSFDSKDSDEVVIFERKCLKYQQVKTAKLV